MLDHIRSYISSISLVCVTSLADIRLRSCWSGELFDIMIIIIITIIIIISNVEMTYTNNNDNIYNYAHNYNK